MLDREMWAEAKTNWKQNGWHFPPFFPWKGNERKKFQLDVRGVSDVGFL